MSKVDIIIVTYNARDKLKACLASIRRHTKCTSYTLTVVDNHSTDGTHSFLKSLGSDVNVIRTRSNMGFSYAANVALKKTTREYVALLDDDVEVSQGWLEGLYRQMKRGKNVGIVGPKVVFPDNVIFCADCSIKRIIGYGNDEIDKGQRNYVKECDAIPGPCWLMRRELTRDIGYFDEHFYPCFHEDIDYCLRTRLAGYKIIYCGKIRVVHHCLCRHKRNEEKNTKFFKNKWKDVMIRLPLKDSSEEIKLIEKGLDYYYKGEWLGALRCFERVEKICKGFVTPYYIARTLYGLRRYNESRAEFEKALGIYHPDSYFYEASMRLLCEIYNKLGLGQQALDMFSRLLEMSTVKKTYFPEMFKNAACSFQAVGDKQACMF